MKILSKSDIAKKMEGYVPIGEKGYKHFAVLVPVVGSEDPELLYEVRARKLDRQPGEVCFPGGMIEPGETPEQCALRETCEEVGIPADQVEIVCELDTIHSTAGSQIHSFLGLVSDEGFRAMEPCDSEVEEVFTVPVSMLMETEPEMYTNKLVQTPDEDFPYDRVTGGNAYPWRSGKSPVPVYDTGKHIVWGLTGRITKQLMEVLKG